MMSTFFTSSLLDRVQSLCPKRQKESGPIMVVVLHWTSIIEWLWFNVDVRALIKKAVYK